MSATFKKYGSLFLLSIFLFAYTEKGVHDIMHADDPHCMAHEKHFHTQEHHCFICDFEMSVFDDGTTSLHPAFFRNSSNAPYLVTESTLAFRYSTVSFTRGPPVLA